MEKAGLKSRSFTLVNEITNKSKNNIYSAGYFCHGDSLNVKKQQGIVLPEQNCPIFVFSFDRGCPNKRAEIIPKSPDPGNAGVGKKLHTLVVFLVYIFTNPLFYFINPR